LSRFRSSKVLGILVALIVIILTLALSITYQDRMGPALNTSGVQSATAFDTSFTWSYNLPLSVNYNGSWRLVYSGENGTIIQNEVTESLTSSGNYTTSVTVYGLGYFERELCVNATKLDPYQNAVLTLFAFGTNKSSISSNPTIGICDAGVPVNIQGGLGIPSTTPYYFPSTITVVIGVNNTVIWTNNDGGTHTVTADNGAFDSGYMNPGETWSYTFLAPGTYVYRCSLHPWMTGTVIVVPG